MKVDALIASLVGVRDRRVGHARNDIGLGSLVPETAGGLVPLLALAALAAVALLAVAALPAHPLALVALWVGAMGLLIALPLVAVLAVGELLIALDG